MTFKTFLIGLLASFGVPWLSLVVIPFGKMRGLEPVRFTVAADGRDEIYVPRRPGRIPNGAAVYAAEGCYVCHTQVIRPSFAGSELGRPDWAGFEPTKEDPEDTRRETTPFDYAREDFAQLGLMRYGPDLSNLAGRVEGHVRGDDRYRTPEDWLYRHLHDPRHKETTYWSTCPSQRHHFVTRPVRGQRGAEALPVDSPEGTEVVPGERMRALVSYLLSLRKDDPVPSNIDYRRRKPAPQP